jgi:tetratricopeptide (TPR) repeat protein
MEQGHPTAEQLDRLLHGSLERADLGAIVRHLLHGCESCRGAMREAWRRERRPPASEEPDRYEAAFQSALAAVRGREVDLAHERIVAPGLFAVLEDLPLAEQERRVRDERRFQTWGFCTHLLEESRGQIFDASAARAVDLARLAVAVADSLDPHRYRASLVEDLHARVRAELGNALRADSEFAAARAAFAEARAHLGRGTGDRGIEARILSLEASLLIDLGRWEEAQQACDRALAVYRSWGSEDLVARTLVQKAIPLGFVDPATGVRLFSEAERLIRRADNPRLFLCARHNRIFFLNDAGHSDAALLLLEESRPLYRQFHDESMQLRLRWLEARIALGLGHLDEAEAALSLLWSFVFERRLHLELALVTLDLTAVYVEKGEMQKAWRTAGRLVPLFQSWGVHAEAMAAWLLLQRAFSAKTASGGLIREVACYLQRSWKNPELCFEPKALPSLR